MSNKFLNVLSAIYIFLLGSTFVLTVIDSSYWWSLIFVIVCVEITNELVSRDRKERGEG